MNPVYDSSQEIHLISSKAFGLFFEQWSILVDDILICRLKILLGSSFIRTNGYPPFDISFRPTLLKSACP